MLLSSDFPHLSQLFNRMEIDTDTPMKRGKTPVSGHISFMPRSRIRRISEGFKIFFPLPFSSEVVKSMFKNRIFAIKKHNLCNNVVIFR
jgi:hypothetical protein